MIKRFVTVPDTLFDSIRGMLRVVDGQAPSLIAAPRAPAR
jgi:hypothetical protein